MDMDSAGSLPANEFRGKVTSLSGEKTHDDKGLLNPNETQDTETRLCLSTHSLPFRRKDFRGSRCSLFILQKLAL